MKILLLGGDLRQSYAYDLLKRKGYDVSLILNFTLSQITKNLISESDVIALPIPVSSDGMHLYQSDISMLDLINCISKNSTVYGGFINSDMKHNIAKKGIDVKNLFDFEDFTINNALISAEGALYYVKQKYLGSIYKARVAVLGFGRIGKILSFYLNAHGAEVTVFARKDTDLAWCRLIGFEAFSSKVLDTNYKGLCDYDIIFNTVPFRLMSESYLNGISKNTVIMDLASAPYGIDGDLAKKLNLNYYRELSIPGRYAPKSAGEIIATTIINDITEKGA